MKIVPKASNGFVPWKKRPIAAKKSQKSACGREQQEKKF
jgi:hypothetical protein